MARSKFQMFLVTVRSRPGASGVERTYKIMTFLGVHKAAAVGALTFNEELGFPQNVWSVDVEELGPIPLDERGLPMTPGDEIGEWQELGSLWCPETLFRRMMGACRGGSRSRCPLDDLTVTPNSAN